MREPSSCPKCGSTDVIPDVRVMGRTEGSHQPVDLRVDAHPNAVFLKKSSYAELIARVCGSCGYAEFFVEEPELLLEAWRTSQERPS